MVYKIISEWKSKTSDAHEITMYKYNLSHDEVRRYNKEGFELLITTQVFGTSNIFEECYDLRDGAKKWWNYNKMVVKH